MERDVRDAGNAEGTTVSCSYFGRGNGDGCTGCPANSVNDDCELVVFGDILRRAKELAGVQ